MTSSSPASVPVPPPSARPSYRLGLGCIIGLLVLAAIIIGFMTLAVAAFRAFRLGPEAAGLREAAREHFVEHGDWHPTIELRLGPLLCTLTREILIHAADDPDATAILRAARTVQVGVYRVNDEAPEANTNPFLRDATTTMTKRGWTRAVTVVDGSSTVLVFVPNELPAGRDVEFGVLVRDGGQLVIAVVQARVAPLLDLVERHGFRHLAEHREPVGR